MLNDLSFRNRVHFSVVQKISNADLDPPTFQLLAQFPNLLLVYNQEEQVAQVWCAIC